MTASKSFLRDAEALAGSLVEDALLQTGLNRSELARRSGVPRSVISEIEHGRRQPSLPVLLRILLGAGLDLRTRLAPHDDQDDVLEAHYEQLSPEEREAADRRHAAHVEAFANAEVTQSPR